MAWETLETSFDHWRQPFAHHWSGVENRIRDLENELDKLMQACLDRRTGLGKEFRRTADVLSVAAYKRKS